MVLQGTGCELADSMLKQSAMRIAYVEDNPTLLRTIADGLRKAGYVVDCAENGEDGLWLLQNHDFDAAILDILLPKIDGLTVLRTLRSEGIQTHIILLTARDATEDRIKGLRAGADDYLVKPFSFDELLARIEALIRRRYIAKSPVVRVDDIELDRASREVRRDGQPVPLRPREYKLLELLMLRTGEVVTRTEIEHRIYDEHVSPASNVVDTSVCALRRKLGPPQQIQTIHGHGYTLKSTGQK